jgi:LysM repeat protein
MGVYVIKAGDTGEKIAAAQDPPLTLAQLFAENPGVNWDSLPVGYHIHIPGYKTTQYLIAPGDSGIAIAGRLGIPFSVLENLNPGTKWGSLEVNKTITIPSFDPARVPLLQGCIGAPISGVPAQMPLPQGSAGTTMTEPVVTKMTKLLGSEYSDALKRVFGLEWVGCFFLFLSNARTLTPGGLKANETPVVVIVDVRDPSNGKLNDQLI